MSKEHDGVVRVAVQTHGVLNHDAHRIRQSVGHLPRNNGDAAAKEIGR
jgi:hypothetical protein